MHKRTNFSSIATSIEQSKRLIAAGLDPKSADMCYATLDVEDSESYDELLFDLIARPYSEYIKYVGPLGLSYRARPAWSLSRLIDIHRNFDYGPMDDGSSSVIDCLVYAICNEIKYETGRVREEFIVKRPLGQPQETEGA